MDTKDTTITGRQASSRFLSVELRGQPRLLASVRLRMPSGLEADLPEGLAIEDIVRLLKGPFWDIRRRPRSSYPPHRPDRTRYSHLATLPTST